MKSSKEKEDFPTQVGHKRFAQWKKTALSKADLSRKGSIDEPLVEWVNLGMFKIIGAREIPWLPLGGVREGNMTWKYEY